MSHPAGDVHVGVVDREGQLEVEINQARGLTPKPGSKNIPGEEPYGAMRSFAAFELS